MIIIVFLITNSIANLSKPVHLLVCFRRKSGNPPKKNIRSTGLHRITSPLPPPRGVVTYSLLSISNSLAQIQDVRRDSEATRNSLVTGISTQAREDA